MKRPNNRAVNPALAQGLISKRILAQLQKVSTSKVVDLKQFKAGKENAERLQEIHISGEKLMFNSFQIERFPTPSPYPSRQGRGSTE